MIIKANQTITSKMLNRIGIFRHAKVIPKGRIFKPISKSIDIAGTWYVLKRKNIYPLFAYRAKWFNVVSE